MRELKTRRLFADLIPPLSIEERGELENSIMDEGCRDAICVWDGVIVDGHNRYEICKRRGRAFRVKEMHFANDDEAVAWIIRNQFGRRNLTAMQRAELALKLKEAVAAEAKKRQGARNDLKPKKDIPPKLAESLETRDELAKVAGVSHGTLSKVEKIVTEAEPEVVSAARRGEISINAAYKTVAAPPDAQKTPSDAPAPEAANDTPEPSGRTTRREIAVPVDSAAPVRRMKNWERFKDRHEATAAHAAEKIVFGCGWGEIEWLYMDYIPDEPRIDYLKRLSKLSILKSEGFRELKRLEKAEKAKKEAK